MNRITFYLALLNVAIAAYMLVSGEGGGWLPSLLGWCVVAIDNA